MKLRFRENSLRLRVNRREVEALAAGRQLHEEVHFPGDTRMAYVLEAADRSSFAASYDAGTIRISAPRNQVMEWAESDLIGLYSELPARDSFLRIAIEKDLECIDGPEPERDPEAFPRSPGARAC